MPTLQQQGLVEERPRPARRPAHGADRLRALVQSWLDEADVKLDGDRPWDFQIKHPKVLERVLAEGSLGLGEAYMDGWWECERLDEFFARVLRARLDERVKNPSLVWRALKARLINLQSVRRAWHVGEVHYDLGSDFFEAMLDPYMAYSCGY